MTCLRFNSGDNKFMADSNKNLGFLPPPSLLSSYLLPHPQFLMCPESQDKQHNWSNQHPSPLSAFHIPLSLGLRSDPLMSSSNCVFSPPHGGRCATSNNSRELPLFWVAGEFHIRGGPNNNHPFVVSAPLPLTLINSLYRTLFLRAARA